MADVLIAKKEDYYAVCGLNCKGTEGLNWMGLADPDKILFSEIPIIKYQLELLEIDVEVIR